MDLFYYRVNIREPDPALLQERRLRTSWNKTRRGALRQIGFFLKYPCIGWFFPNGALFSKEPMKTGRSE
jgi:hypothetical protein